MGACGLDILSQAIKVNVKGVLMGKYVMLGGELVESEKARVFADDRGFLYGDGLFETVRCYQGRVYRLDDHLERLAKSAAFLKMDVRDLIEKLPSWIGKLLEVNELADARIRITVTRGRHSGILELAGSTELTTHLAAWPMPVIPAERYEKGIKLVTAGVPLFSGDPLTRHKTLNYLPYLLARDQAREAGGDEALLLDEKSNVAECSTANLFMVKHRALFTAPLIAPILPGVTRKAILELACEQGLTVREEFFSSLALISAEEVFISNSVQEIVPVCELDGRILGEGRPGPMTRALMQSYKQALTPVPRHLKIAEE